MVGKLNSKKAKTPSTETPNSDDEVDESPETRTGTADLRDSSFCSQIVHLVSQHSAQVGNLCIGGFEVNPAPLRERTKALICNANDGVSQTSMRAHVNSGTTAPQPIPVGADHIPHVLPRSNGIIIPQSVQVSTSVVPAVYPLSVEPTLHDGKRLMVGRRPQSDKKRSKKDRD